MKIYKYKVNYSRNIEIQEIEATEKNVIYVAQNRERIRKDEIDQVKGRVFTSCLGCCMYSLSNDKVDFFKEHLIKALEYSKAYYEETVKICEKEITAIKEAIIYGVKIEIN